MRLFLFFGVLVVLAALGYSATRSRSNEIRVSVSASPESAHTSPLPNLPARELPPAAAVAAVPVSPATATPVPLPTAARIISDLPHLGAAPELSNTVWLNVDAPLRLADLRGKVVLLDMWTFG